MYFIYKTLTTLASPLIPLLLDKRLKQGKEKAERMGERLGAASLPRPEGTLLWIHAASVGESNSVLPLITALLVQFPHLHILLTTVTVTSAELMQTRLPKRGIHQFAVVDTQGAVNAFLDYWRPDVALWVDSEFWPNILVETHKRGIVMGIINARMSEKSFQSWKRFPGFIKTLLSGFSFCFAQSAEDGERLSQLGISRITAIGNLKYDAPELPFNPSDLIALKASIANRPLWLAASTHRGEEALIAIIHRQLKEKIPNLLTIIVPRHANRGNEVAEMLSGLAVARRSKGESVEEKTDIYLADTMGELGLFYRLAPIAFIGGTLVEHGGQNPLEAARAGCAIITAEHYENFAAVMHEMQQDKAILIVKSSQELASTLEHLLLDSASRSALGEAAAKHVKSKGGIMRSIMNELQPVLT